MAKSKKKVVMPAGIRNKMMAAVSMLLVSSIMMVSSTYAWFTLSTAPEVKNISTTVAGNGSLEIALMPTGGTFKEITSGFSSEQNGGDVAVKTANTTWGNVIYLNDNDTYGLSSVSLNPAELNTDTETFATNPLVIPVYGYDGRIDSKSATTVLRSFDGEAFTDDTSYGVRAIGEDDGTGLNSYYGYAIDLAFRLNATNNSGTTTAAGKLLLQTAEKQRIYNDETTSNNSETLGGGSYMSFDVSSVGLSDAALKTLMDSVRITFVQNYGLNDQSVEEVVLGTARLDTANFVKGATETKASLYLVDSTETTDGNDTEETTTVKLQGEGGVLLDAMEKNTAVQITAIVWLDGNNITNASVSAAKGAFAQATLNLQFSTDVTLKPAQNIALIEGSAQ